MIESTIERVTVGQSWQTARSVERISNYLRTYRRRWHLTQEELALLFGYMDQSIIARLEREERAITLAVAHACELVFGVKPKEIFPALFESLEEDVANRMHELHDDLMQMTPTQKTLAKLELLQYALNRMSTAGVPHEI